MQNKIKIIVFILIVILLFSGCGTLSENAPEKSNTQSYVDNDVAEKTEAEKTEIDSIIDDYKLQYKSEFAYRDVLVDNKFILINETQITEVLYIPSVPQIKIVPQNGVTRVENTAFGEFSVVKIYDKTNSFISINISTEAVDTVIDLLEYR